MRQPTLNPPIADQEPNGPALTPYDEEHLIVYIRLLDAETDGCNRRGPVSGCCYQREENRLKIASSEPVSTPFVGTALAEHGATNIGLMPRTIERPFRARHACRTERITDCRSSHQGCFDDGSRSLELVGNQATTYTNRERRRLWSSRPSFWLVVSSVVDLLIATILAIAGIAMTPLPALVVAGTFAATIAFAVILDLVKVPVFRRLAITSSAHSPVLIELLCTKLLTSEVAPGFSTGAHRRARMLSSCPDAA
jgi:hypothetical protein